MRNKFRVRRTKTLTIARVPGSYRDPDGHVYAASGKVYRGIMRQRANFVREFLQSNFFVERQGKSIIATNIVADEVVISAGISREEFEQYELWVEHDHVPLISYPYEWCFEALKQAASLTLTLQIEALESGYTLRDASAFNVQFINSTPIFIDFLSFARYDQNSPFIGYKQFCEHFFAPLCLSAYTDIEFNSWFRGRLDGLSLVEVSEILPLRAKLNPAVFFHIQLHSVAIRKMNVSGCSDAIDQKKSIRSKDISPKNLLALMNSLRRTISKLEQKKVSYWQNYSKINSYPDDARNEKAKILSRFIKKYSIGTILDLGCNIGDYTGLAIKSGATRAVGLDTDCGSINFATMNANEQALPAQFLVFDIVNPSPNSGWMNEERTVLQQRLGSIDGLLCFALIHHIAIGKNIPIDQFIRWIVSLAPRGLIEFVPKSDPMTEQILRGREDIFTAYSQDNFEKCLHIECGEFTRHELPATTRSVYEYVR